MISDELERLSQLREQGTITDEEFARAKEKLLADDAPLDAPKPFRESMNMEENTYCMLLHLSQFAHLALPGGGWAVPIALWLIGREKSVLVDAHGRAVANWMISGLIYSIVAFILCFVMIGFPMFIALIIVGIMRLMKKFLSRFMRSPFFGSRIRLNMNF